MKTILLIFGTRPEAIKMAPIVQELQNRPNTFRPLVCVTAQHREMLDQVLDLFDIRPDFDLNLMKSNQSLVQITAEALRALDPVLEETTPDWVLVQGDTTTALTGALGAFYRKVKVGHVEAGLRTGNKYAPFPEEVNRRAISTIADLHFAPTTTAQANLLQERATGQVYVVGNTVIDALLRTRQRISAGDAQDFRIRLSTVDFSRRLILVTGHRRESFGAEMQNIARALEQIVVRHSDVEIVYPLHLNRNVREPMYSILGEIPRVHLIEPLDYRTLVWLMSEAHLVLTDSGGIQEEAPTFGKPVLVMRSVTERPEGIEAGVSKLVGTNLDTIVEETHRLLTDPAAYQSMSRAVNPYGDGNAATRIVDILASDAKE